MKRRWIVYSVVNIVQFCAVMAGWAYVKTPEYARASAGWRWPLAGTAVIDRPFQPPASRWGAGHRGVDLRGESGQEVRAAGAGTVAYSGLLAGRGVVVVKHADGLRTTYEPVLDGPAVGTEVDGGSRIGRLAGGHPSCRAGTTCLHWGLRRGELYLDPLRLVMGGQVRLLPVPPAAEAARSRAGALDPRDTFRVQPRTSQDPLAQSRPVEHVSLKRGFVNMTVNVLLLAALAFALVRGTIGLVRLVRRRRRAA